MKKLKNKIQVSDISADIPGKSLLGVTIVVDTFLVPITSELIGELTRMKNHTNVQYAPTQR